MKKIVIGILVSFGCIACSVGPDYIRPQIYKDEDIVKSLKLKTDSKYVQDNFWYKKFGDKTLNRFVNNALIHNYNIKSAIENVKQARYKVYIERAGFLPSIDAKGTYNQNSQKSALMENDYFQLGADATWEIDIWGGQRRLNENAAALLKKASADFENVKITLIAETVSQYVNWRLSQKLLHIAEQNLQFQNNIFETIKAKYDAGLADDLDYEQAKEAINITKMKIPEFKQQVNAYKNALAILTGKLPDEIDAKQKIDIFENIPKLHIEKIYNLPADVIRKRPDVVAAEQNLIAQNALIGNATANLFPSVSLTAFLGWQNNTLSPIFGSDFNMYEGNGIVNLPVLHWGSLINQLRIRESATKQALYSYQGAILTAVADVSNAMKNLKEEYTRNESAKENAVSAKTILDLSLLKYENGLIDFAQISENEQNKLQSDIELAQSNGQLYLNIVSFYKAVTNYSQKNDDGELCMTHKD